MPYEREPLGIDFARKFMSGKPLLRQKRTLSRRFVVHLMPEEEGGFSVVSAELPGVASQGETVEEALENIKEALVGVIEHFKQEGKKIPWLALPEEPEKGAIVRSVIVPAHG